MPTYNRGDYVKVEVANEATGVGELMWVRVSRCDDRKQLVFGTLDSEPLNDYDGQIGLGAELAVSYSPIRERRKPRSPKTPMSQESGRTILGGAQISSCSSQQSS